MYIANKDEIAKSFKEFSEMVPGGFYLFSVDHKLLGINSFTLKTANANLDDVLGKTPLEMHPKEMAEEIIAHHKKVIETGNQLHCEERVKDMKTGETVYFDVVLSPIYDKDNNIIGVCGISTDITTLKNLGQRLKNKNEELRIKNLELKHQYEKIELKNEELRQQKELQKEFINTFAHEVRTPLNGVSGYTQIIRGMSENEQMHKYANVVVDACADLADMYQQISNAMQQNKFENVIYDTDFDFSKFFKSLVTTVNTSLVPGEKQDKIEFEYHVDENIPQMVKGDLLKSAQIVRNLLTNSIKYTEEGSITLDVKLLSENKKGYMIRFVVQDTGIGIDKQHRESIFELGRRIEPAFTTNIRGLGLGLHIVRNHVKTLKANLNLESELGVGTKITVDIPFRVSEFGRRNKVAGA